MRKLSQAEAQELLEMKDERHNHPSDLRPKTLIRVGGSGTETPIVYAIEPARTFDINMYANKKSAANGLMDLALLMANASQLKFILTSDSHKFYWVMITLLLSSIALQIVVGIGLLVLARHKVSEVITNDDTHARNQRADKLNSALVAAIFLLTTVNVFISAFGMSEPVKEKEETFPTFPPVAKSVKKDNE